MPEQTFSSQGITWDLSDLFAAPDDPRISETLESIQQEATTFADAYRGTINVPAGPTPGHLLAGLQRLEDLMDRTYRVSSYAGLLYAGDASNPVYQNLQMTVEERFTALRNLLLFFDLEWLDLPDEVAQALIDHPDLANYRHYLASERRYKPHKLSEPEEKIVNEKDITGQRAWARLHQEVTSSLKFPFETDGEKRDMTMSEILNLFYHPDRDTRRKGHDTLYDVLEGHSKELAYVYNTLVQDQLIMQRLRQYAGPMEPRHLDNEIPPTAVDQMMVVVERNYPIAHRYFALKGRLLGLPDMMIYDQYAPATSLNRTITFHESRDLILTALENFTPEFARIASDFFSRNWIDAEIRPGKRNGAFCSGSNPKLHPYILCNYTDNPRDAMTVAHELGHGIHFVMAGRNQTLLNYFPSLPVAETASVFAELIFFEYLVGREQDPVNRLALVAKTIEDMFATVFRQNVLTRFEQQMFAARQKSRLTDEQIGEIWLAANKPYYGDAVRLTERYRWGWSYIPHFINTPFYCYSYVFGELLVLALYGMYRREGASFIPKYIRLLSAGGSQAPADVLRPLGVDINDPDFWQLGFDEIARLVGQAEDLAGQVG